MRPETLRVGKRGTVVIPAPVRRRLGIEEGSVLLVDEMDEGILLRPGVVTRAPMSRPRAGSANDALMSKREEILRVASNHGARNVRVFGSGARGEAGPASDLDLLVVLDKGRSLLDLIGLSQDLTALLGRKVDVITDEGLSPYLRARIQAEAVPV